MPKDLPFVLLVAGIWCIAIIMLAYFIYEAPYSPSALEKAGLQFSEHMKSQRAPEDDFSWNPVPTVRDTDGFTCHTHC